MSTKVAKKGRTKKTNVEKPKVLKRTRKKEPAKEKRVARVEEKVEERQEHRRLSKPTGTIPHPRVLARHNGSLKERSARGFSWGELSAAGVERRVARGWGVQVDIRRRSTVTSNVERLKSWLQAGESTKAVSVRKAGPSKKK